VQVNHRGDQRRNVTAEYSICWRDGAGQMRSAVVHSQDISNSGVRIRSAVELAAGTTVYLECKDSAVRGYSTVRHCTLRDAAYDIGLEFDEAICASTTDASGTDADHYEFLQISPRAELPTIHRIYRFMASRFHPDNPATGDPEKFLRLKRAYEVLTDPERRAEYDAKRENREVPANPIFEMSEFVNGIGGEINRRLGVLSLLYTRRRTNPEDPKISLYDLEKRMGWPREYLDFTTWYLRSMQYITREDNSDFALTAIGVNYVEENSTKIPILNKLLNSGAQTTTSSASPAPNRHPNTPGDLLLVQGDASSVDANCYNGAMQ